MASGNSNPFGITDGQRLAPERYLRRDKAEKGWVSKRELDASFSDFSRPE